MRHLLIILSLVFINPFLLAIGEAGATFLLISPSPTINGFGGAGTSVSTTDIYSSYYNPAQPQLPNGLSVQSSNSKTDWLSNLTNDIDYNYNVSMIGYNGFSFLNRYTLQGSITKSETVLNLGNQELVLPYFEYMKADATTFSLGLQSNSLPIFLGAGITSKKVKLFLDDMVSAGEVLHQINKLYDWGFKFSIYDYKLNQNIGLNYSIGYSKSNIGDGIAVYNPDQSDPAPTTSRFGMTFGGSFFILNDLGVEFKLIREAEDLMLEYDSSMEVVSKDGYLGDIDIEKHIFKGKADKDIVIHKGAEITFNNFLSLRTGQYIDLDGDIECKTIGLGINFSESIKFASNTFFDSSEIKLLDYFNLKYNFSFYSLEQAHPLSNTIFNELTLSIKNIDNIF